MARYEMKNSVVDAWQWDGTVAGAQSIQAQFGDAQEMSFYQSAKAGSTPSLQMRDTKGFNVITATPSHFVIMMADSRSLQVMDATAFGSQYTPKADDTPASSAGTAPAGPTDAASSPGASPTSPDATKSPSPSTGSASPSP